MKRVMSKRYRKEGDDFKNIDPKTTKNKTRSMVLEKNTAEIFKHGASPAALKKTLEASNHLRR